MLLEWSTLQPSGSSNLAAIRFSAPVQVKLIRIFPTDSQPFSHSPDIIARTEPDAFYLNVYFNAHPIAQGDKQKQKSTNELVPTVIPYAGVMTDFNVDMGTDYATRLMIVQGDFESVSMAIYGDIATGLPSPPTTYHPKPVSSFPPVPLNKQLDTSNMNDPTLLAQQLLALIPDAPPLAMIIRLMYCIKATDAEWEHPDFPYLYVDLDQNINDFDLEKACKMTTRQISDELSLDQLHQFADVIMAAIGPSNSDQSYYIAGLLSNLASQNPELVNVLLGRLDLAKIFESSHLDKYTLSKLVQAATNSDIARSLNYEWFFDMVSNVHDHPGVDPEAKADATKLIATIQGWQILEDGLSNTQADFHSAAAMLKAAGTHELNFGIWLESMVAHPDISTKLAENPVLPIPLPHPPLLLRPPASISHDDFIAFLRAYIGVACVVAVYAWSDSLPNVRCRERTLATLRLWQGIDGYREIVNHLLLIPQMTFRLESMVDNNYPTRQGIDAENILINLAYDPQAVLSQDLRKCLFSLKQPLSCITEEERFTMRKLAELSDGGLPAAVEQIANLSEQLDTMRNVRVLRVALAILDVEFHSDDGEWRILKALWAEGLHGLVYHTANAFITLSTVIKSHFGLQFPTRYTQEFINQVFRAANETLQLFNRLLPSYPLSPRALRRWTASVADLFTCTDAADMVLAQYSSACIAAQEARQTCVDSMRMLSASDDLSEEKSASEVVFRALLIHGLQPDGLEPVHHLLQVSCLLDHLIPFPNPDDLEQDNLDDVALWCRRVIPNALEDLQLFIQALDPENKAHIVKRLINLDNGVTGVGEWIILEDLKDFFQTVQHLDDHMYQDAHRYKATLYLRFIRDLVLPSSSVSWWCLELIKNTSEIAHLLSSCLGSLLTNRFSSHHISDIAYTLAKKAQIADAELRSVACVALLRAAQEKENSLADLEKDLSTARDLLQHIPNQSEQLQQEIGIMTSALDPAHISNESIAIAVTQILEWLANGSAEPVALPGVIETQFTCLRARLREHVAPDRIDSLKAKLEFSEGMLDQPDLTPLPTKLSLSLDQIQESLLSRADLVPSPSTPPLKPQGQDVISLVNISPSAVLRSPLVTGLTKTYLKNDFRQLRQSTATRQNTSRLPSMHVDDFELNVSVSPALRPVLDSSIPPKPIMTSDVFQSLSPAFNPQ